MQEKNQNEKYAAFEQQVIAAAKKQAEQIIAEANEYRNDELASVKKTYTKENYERSREQLEQQRKRTLSQAKLEGRKQLLLHREELVSGLFNKITKNLNDFVSGDQYVDFLLKSVQSYAQEYRDDISDVIFVAKKDMVHEKAFKNILPECTVAVDNNILIGGVKISNGKVIHDKTLDFALETEHDDFLTYCNLSV